MQVGRRAAGERRLYLAHRRRYRRRAFPDRRWPRSTFEAVLDGELLVVRGRRGGAVQRSAAAAQPQERRAEAAGANIPAFMRALRHPVRRRRGPARPCRSPSGAQRLEAWYARLRPSASTSRRCMPFAPLGRAGGAARTARAMPRHEGLMLKRRDSPMSPAGRRGLVQVEARRAHRRRRADVCPARPRQALVLLFRLHLRRLARRIRRRPTLVPVGKAYFGFTDEELRQLDKWVRDNTVDRFGPVREVRAGGLVLRGGVRQHPALDPPQIGRRHALPADQPHPLGQAGGRGGPG